MSFFHSHCKECDKVIPWGWDYCSIGCEQAKFTKVTISEDEYIEYIKLRNNYLHSIKKRNRRKIKHGTETN